MSCENDVWVESWTDESEEVSQLYIFCEPDNQRLDLCAAFCLRLRSLAILMDESELETTKHFALNEIYLMNIILLSAISPNLIFDKLISKNKNWLAVCLELKTTIFDFRYLFSLNLKLNYFLIFSDLWICFLCKIFMNYIYYYWNIFIKLSE